MENIGFKIDVSGIFNGEKKEIPFEFELLPEEIDIAFPKPVCVSGRVYEMAGGNSGADSYVVLEMRLCGEYAAHCARCAEKVTKTFDINAQFGVAEEVSEDETDYVEAKGGILDAGETARTVFYLELPSKVLCRETCRGLCPMCGRNLNTGICSCQPDSGKRKPLADLKKLLDN